MVAGVSSWKEITLPEARVAEAIFSRIYPDSSSSVFLVSSLHFSCHIHNSQNKNDNSAISNSAGSCGYGISVCSLSHQCRTVLCRARIRHPHQMHGCKQSAIFTSELMYFGIYYFLAICGGPRVQSH